jgi:hypothetical protein
MTDTVPALSAAKKAALWFVVTFLGLFIPGLLEALTEFSGTLDINVLGAAVVALLSATSVTVLRMVIAYLPILAQDRNIGMAPKG